MQEQARAELLIEAAAFSRVEVAPPCSVPKLLHSSGVTVSLHVTPSGPILTVSNCASSKQRSKTVPADWKRPRSTEGSFASLALTRKDLELVGQRRAPRANNSVRRKPLACALADGVMRRDNKADIVCEGEVRDTCQNISHRLLSTSHAHTLRAALAKHEAKRRAQPVRL